MGDMGLDRTPPEGWLPARAMPLNFGVRATSRANENDGSEEVETSVLLDVLWEIHVEGWQPYRVEEVRKAPVWVRESGALGHGDRWYKRSLGATGGLLPSLGVPGYVNPQEPRQLWVAWDTAHDEHQPAWKRDAAVEREIASRKGGLDKVLDRVTNPFGPKVTDEDRARADHLMAEEQRRQDTSQQQWQAWGMQQMAAMGFGAPLTAEQRADAQAADTARLLHTGMPAQAVVAECIPTGETVRDLPMYELRLEVAAPEGTRRIVHFEALDPARAAAFPAGATVAVRLDPLDTTKLALG